MSAVSEIHVPDIGDFKDVEIIEVHVEPGQEISAEDPVLTLESDKASMEVPSPVSGKVVEVKVKVGDTVSEGTLMMTLESGEASAPVEPPSPDGHQESDARPIAEPEKSGAPPVPPKASGADKPDFSDVHASPSVRRLARELEIDLNKVSGTGEKGRITRDDVKAFLGGGAPSGAAAAPAAGAGIPEVPLPDFSKFGPIEEKPLGRIKKISGPHLHRAWLNVPAVTHCDEADITETDKFRKELDTVAKDKGYRVTLLAFLIKASVSALRKFPEFNSSLDPAKSTLIYKHYYNVGIAVDTPDGLVVPVIRDADRKGIDELSREMGEISARARDGKLGSADLQGATFTISSLGGIGGTAFSPIVNAPEVAILGVVRSKMAPVWNGSEFVPRNMLPVCLSYDHRVIDGALAARFARHLCHVIEDVRRLAL
ncbi:MAG: dihydrolipoyllysine-residue acetyltransferase [Geminicoccaceae bacterium]|nr:dihydrolipoyllysine-residue acetyltransferase [Geminicoccaceae bacterium]